MPIICPTVTPSTDPHDYREQLERVAPFAPRIHLDFMDGVLAPTTSIGLAQAWWPEGKQIDLHLMYKNPADHLETILGLKPSLVIVHAESEGSFPAFADKLRAHGIRVGVALLPKTPAEVIKPALGHIDHVMIFGGLLGHYGGHADISLLAKAQECKEMKPELEIGWDGGINEHNVHLFAAAGIDVMNVGGFIQKSADPARAYATLVEKLHTIAAAPRKVEDDGGYTYNP
jgi:ribulose-phosphate 3-epimerase